jgi:polyisoprenyl-phosphate glycosyltransferase
VSVVLPVYRNAETLPELARRIRAAFPDRPLQIVMVDDASPDDSLAVIRSLGVECVSLPENRGQNRAILAGLSQAREPLTCVMDADLEDPPEVLPKLVERLERGDVKVVFSSRTTDSPLTSRVFRFVMQRMFPSLPSTPCLFFALGADTRAELLGIASERDYVVAAIGALGVPTAVVVARRGARKHGRSGYSALGRLRYAARALGSAARLRVRSRPS